MNPRVHPNQWDQTCWRRLTDACLRYADASDDDKDFLKARDRLRKAAIAYGLSSLAGRRAVAQRRRVVVVNQMAFWPRSLL